MPEEDGNIFGRCFDRMDAGIDRGGMVAYLHSQGVPVSEAVLITMKLYGLRMAEAGRVVTAHPAWQEEVLALKPGALTDWLRGLASQSPNTRCT